MKENQTTCPCCGQTVQPTQWLFEEQHTNAWRKQLRDFSFHVPDHCYGKDYGMCYGYDADGDWSICEKIHKPQALANWERHNPRPKIGMMEFVIQLHNRIAALEAALAQKGGAR